jgi:hypothetical protein
MAAVETAQRSPSTTPRQLLLPTAVAVVLGAELQIPQAVGGLVFLGLVETQRPLWLD